MTSRVLVTGGTGRLGRELVPACLRRGWTVRVMSRQPPQAMGPGVERATADLSAAAGVNAAVEGVDVVLHLASLPYRGRRTDAVDIEGTQRLLEAAARAGVRHFVYTSIVGVDTIPWPYFRKKLAAEERVRRGLVAWSIIRATQFYPLLDAVFLAAARLPVIAGPADVPGRPVDPRDVAARLVAAVDTGPVGEVADFADLRSSDLPSWPRNGWRPPGGRGAPCCRCRSRDGSAGRSAPMPRPHPAT